MKLYLYVFAAITLTIIACTKNEIDDTNDLKEIEQIEAIQEPDTLEVANENTDETIGNENAMECNVIINEETIEDWYSEFERTTIETCLKNKLEDKEAIEKNLIGKWDLVGTAKGWGFLTQNTCSQLLFTDKEVSVFIKTETVDTVTTHLWEIVESKNTTRNAFYLKTEPSYIGFTNFCEDFIFYDATPVDGDMQIYQKVD